MENSGNETKTPAPKKKWSLKRKVVATTIALVLMGGVANAMGGGNQTQPTPQAKPAQEAQQAPKIETKQTTETEDLSFKTVTQDDGSLPVGQTTVAQEGKNGSRTTTYELTYTDGVQTEKKPVGDPVVVNAVDKIVKNGTYTKPVVKSNCDPNYSGACVPIASDVDCGGGSGNGPAYVYGVVTVVGTDIYGLDRDGDGLGCE